MRLYFLDSTFIALFCSHFVSAAAPVATLATAATTVATLATTTTAQVVLVPVYGQCGGQGYTGSTICAPPGVCTVIQSPYYSQCLPGTATTTTAVIPTNTTTTVIPTTTPVQTTTTTTVTTPTTTIATTTTTTTDDPTDPTLTADPIFVLSQPRTKDMLLNLPGLYGIHDVQRIVDSKLNLTNIQCDILVGMQKNKEWFVFFHINNPASFKKKLHTVAYAWITSVAQMLAAQPQVAVNLAFSQTGLNTIGYGSGLADGPFSKGMWADANNLKDVKPTSNWLPVFQGTTIHGVWLFASDNITLLQYQVLALNNLFGSDITVLYTLKGNARPAPYTGKEMFGWMDGIGQPAVAGFYNPWPGQELVNAGIILAGEVGDTLASARAAWTLDGSFMAFRQLKQLVPEFSQYLLKYAPWIPGWTQQQSADLFGSRMVGRWQSGAPIDTNPLTDSSAALPPNVNNNFDYSHSGFNINTDQWHCPFHAHIRKNRPRADLANNVNLVMRAGIPYGPEVTSAEASQYVSSTSTTLERGLAFVGYQSQIAQGYQFLQTQWMNAPNFPPNKNETVGWDPIMGENAGAARTISGYNQNDASKVLTMTTDFVVPRGGEYFFSPSIPAIKNVLSV